MLEFSIKTSNYSSSGCQGTTVSKSEFWKCKNQRFELCVRQFKRIQSLQLVHCSEHQMQNKSTSPLYKHLFQLDPLQTHHEKSKPFTLSKDANTIYAFLPKLKLTLTPRYSKDKLIISIVFIILVIVFQIIGWAADKSSYQFCQA